jgi:hypothetical protein
MIFFLQGINPSSWVCTAEKLLAFSTRAASYLIINLGAASSFACVPASCNLPAIHVSTYDLWVTCQEVEGNFGL